MFKNTTQEQETTDSVSTLVLKQSILKFGSSSTITEMNTLKTILGDYPNPIDINGRKYKKNFWFECYIQFLVQFIQQNMYDVNSILVNCGIF